MNCENTLIFFLEIGKDNFSDKMKVLTAEDKVASVGKESEPSVVIEAQKATKEELNRFV